MLAESVRNEFNFFKELTDEELSQFLSFCETRQAKAGEMLWKQGDDVNYAAFILSGLICIRKMTKFEGKFVAVGFFEKGSVVGELCLLTNNKRSVNAEAVEPCELLIMSSENFEKLLVKYPLLGLKLLKHIFVLTTKRLNSSYERIASVF